MDAKEYNEFLKLRLAEAQKPLENSVLNLLSTGNEDNLKALYRQVGNRDMLVEFLNKLDPLLEDFYKRHDSNA